MGLLLAESLNNSHQIIINYCTFLNLIMRGLSSLSLLVLFIFNFKLYDEQIELNILCDLQSFYL